MLGTRRGGSNLGGRARAALVAAAALVVGGCAIEPAPGRARAGIIGGEDDTGDGGAVTILIKKPNFSKPFEWCTGTTVSPHVVVTAAHCLAVNLVDVPEGSTLSIFTGADYEYDGPAPPAEQIFAIHDTQIFPDFSDGTAQTEGRDIGVVITEDALPVKPYRLLMTPITKSVVGETVRLVGAGANVLPSEMTYSTGVRKQVSLPVTGLDDHYVHEEGDAGTTCSGDSGGPTLITVDGQELVLGIHEAAVGTPACTGANYDTRIDLYLGSFILPAVEKADPGFIEVDGGTAGAGGGGGAATGGGAGGGGGASRPNEKSSGCAFAPADDGSSLWLVALVGALALRARRRLLGLAESDVLPR